MAETPTTRIWIGRASYLAVAALIIFVQLLPLETMPRTFGAPDVLLALTLAWTARRPDYVPALSVAAVFLLTDMLFQRPPGLWTALVIVLCEMLRARALRMRSIPFMLEWFSVAGGIVGITLLNRFALAVVMTPQVPLGLTLIQMTLTILVYPLIIVISHFVFGVSRPAPGAVDALGHRL